MANPSTVGTTASGTEFLRRKFFHASSNAHNAVITGVTDHIFTLLSIVVCEVAGATEQVSVYVDPDTGTDNISLVQAADIPAYGTYSFTEKVVITNTDILYCFTSTGDCDIWCSYIDQDWS